MNRFTLVLRSLTFHWRTHLGTTAGVAVCSAILVGALLVGDSVRGSLHRMALLRLGKVQHALVSNDRLFQSSLADRIQKNSKVPIAAALLLPGTAANSEGTARANRIQILGVNSNFWQFAQLPPAWTTLPEDATVLGQALAAHLRVAKGDSLLLRAHKPSALSQDAPLAPEEKSSLVLRVKVHDIVNDEQFGRFSLQASQMPALNAFVDLKVFQLQAEATNRANLLLFGGNTAAADLSAALSKSWELEDGELELRPAREAAELRTSRVFLDPPVSSQALQASSNSIPILTYFANGLQVRDKLTPYSMVTGATAPIVPADLKDDEIVISQWVAEDLSAKAGDSLALTYYIVGSLRQLVEQTNTFKIKQVVPLSGHWADRSLMPDFPGLTTAENCRDWDTGFPIKNELIREKDEKYWHDYRGTPKAFITLAAAQALWSNRFGNLTAIRYTSTNQAELRQTLQRSIGPGDIGLSIQPVRAQAEAAANEAQDFGQLFIGFSFFLIGSALMLVALLFGLSLEQRSSEIGTLLAVGFLPRDVRRIFLLEGAGLAAIGSLIGALAGFWYAKLMLLGLSTIWSSAVGPSQLQLFTESKSVLIGIVSALLCGVGTIAWTLRKQANRPARELLSLGAEEDSVLLGTWRTSVSAWVASLSFIFALALAIWAGAQQQGPETFFGAGALGLIAFLAACSFLLARLSRREAATNISMLELGLRNTTRRRKRSRAIIGLFASGVFLIASISAFRLEAGRNAAQRSSGTGGFTFVGESSLPVVHDLNAPAGQQFFGLDEKAMQNVNILPMRLRHGEDASCLNLNRAQKPRLLSVVPETLDKLGAFSFSSVQKGLSHDHPWLHLRANPQEPDVVPAIGDAASIQYALGKKVGDILEYPDEHGRVFKLRIVGAVANSILQGNLLIAEDQFVKKFPSETGYRMFLVDAPSKDPNVFSSMFIKGLQDVGLELLPATERLEAFNAVQNTYLSTFQVLGGLGLILGSVGLAVVVMRNVHERRAELALFMALGFRRSSIQRLVLSETAALLVLGLLSGLLAGLLAVLPQLLNPRGAFPYQTVGLILAAILATGLVWTWIAAKWATRGQILGALRNS